MIQLSVSEDRLVVDSPMRSGTRILIALLSLIPLMAPYELMVRVRWTDYRHPFFLLAAIITAGAVSLSLLLLFAAVAGLSSRMTFDSAHSTFTHTERAVLIRHRSRTFPLSAVQGVSIHRHEWSDGEPTFSMVITMSDGATLRSGSSSLGDVEAIKARVEGFLAHRK